MKKYQFIDIRYIFYYKSCHLKTRELRLREIPLK